MAITLPDFKDRLYKKVLASTQEEQDFIPASGQKILFTRFGGNSGPSPDTIILVFWDKDGGGEQLLYTSHGDTTLDSPGVEITGDGSKAIKIILRNDLNQDEWLGGFWEGVKLP